MDKDFKKKFIATGILFIISMIFFLITHRYITKRVDLSTGDFKLVIEQIIRIILSLTLPGVFFRITRFRVNGRGDRGFIAGAIFLIISGLINLAYIYYKFM